MNQQRLFEQPDGGPPRLVLGAVALLALLFLAGGWFLWSLRAGGVETVRGPDTVPALTVAVAVHEGPVWSLEKTRLQVRRVLDELGVGYGDPVTVYTENPAKLRPISVRCRTGYVLPTSPGVSDLGGGVLCETLTYGPRWVVRVRGHGRLTGLLALRSLRRHAGIRAVRAGEGERLEIQRTGTGGERTEHWFAP